MLVTWVCMVKRKCGEVLTVAADRAFTTQFAYDLELSRQPSVLLGDITLMVSILTRYGAEVRLATRKGRITDNTEVFCFHGCSIDLDMVDLQGPPQERS